MEEVVFTDVLAEGYVAEYDGVLYIGTGGVEHGEL